MSVDADQVSETLVWVALATARAAGVVGGVVSAEGTGVQAAVESVTDARVEWFPAASYASTAKEYAVPQVSPETVAPGCATVPLLEPFTYTS